MSIYGKLGVRRVINAYGTQTFLGGSIMPPEVVDAWCNAAKWFVHMDELMNKASEVIARLTGAEAGLVTAGADAALSLATAACIARSDPERYSKLPDTTGMKNELIIPEACRNGHNRSLTVSGAKLVYVGTSEGATEEDFEKSLTPNTVAVVHVLFTGTSGAGIEALERAARFAKKHSLPLIVDAAAETPPRENIKRLVALGADLVAYSGGKEFQGPSDTGIFYGRKDLIEAATIQMRTSRTPFGIGRSMKVGKEDIVAAIVAFDRYMNLDMNAKRAAWTRRAQSFIDELKGTPHLTLKIDYPDPAKHEYSAQCYPTVSIALDERTLGISASKLAQDLEERDPRILLPAWGSSLRFNPQCLEDGEEKLVAQAISESLSGKQQHPS